MREKLENCRSRGDVGGSEESLAVDSDNPRMPNHGIGLGGEEGLWGIQWGAGRLHGSHPVGWPPSICGWPGAIVGPWAPELVSRGKNNLELRDPAVLVCNCS